MYSGLFESIRIDLLVAISLISIIYIFWRFCFLRKHFPPGPYGLPVLGYLPLLINKPHLELFHLGKKYGDIFSVKFGSETVVVLNSGELIREVLAKTEFFGRPDPSRYYVVPIQDPFFTNGEIWREHKKFALRIIKDLNANKTMEKHMQADLESLEHTIRAQNGKPFDARNCLFSCTTNTITALNFGKTYDHDDPERKMLDKTLSDGTERIELASAVIFFSWMKSASMLRKLLQLDVLMDSFEYFMRFIKKKVIEQKLTSDESRSKCLSDSYFEELSSKTGKASDTTFAEHRIPGALTILYGAGTETVRDTLIWCFYTMAVFQDAQQKVQDEIDRIIGRTGIPSFSDQKAMRYTQAVLMEVQRWQTVVPLGIRMALSDACIGSYLLPTGTFLIVNHYAAHHDPRCWADPDEFIPERFLSPDEGHVLKFQNYMPFSFGKRSCLGEGIAVVEMFIYFTSVLQKFKVQLPDGEKPNFEGFGSVTYQMKHPVMCFVPRDS